jgi:sialate O-acetylesterase
MVLQRDIADPIWGWTDPGKPVSVTMLGKTVNTKADAEGKWMAKIGPFQAGGPYTLTISGPQTITLNNVMVGDVWLCSGQSNMEFSITSTANAAEEIANANYPNIRLYTVQKTIAFQPTETVSGQWFACSPTTVVKSGGFSAVAYFFGRLLNTELNVPIGLIHASWGGTPAEAWTSEKALLTMPDFKAGIDKVHAHIALLQSGQNDDTANMDAWYKKNDPDSANGTGLADPATPTTDWKTMRLPQQWENVLPNFDGIVWFRKEIDIPEDWAGKDAVLHLSTIDDYDTTWVNGTMVGRHTNGPHRATIRFPLRCSSPGVMSSRCVCWT